jgi:dTDP-4-dehydrorhamnose 3,5-epimerase
MKPRLVQTPLSGLLIVEVDCIRDERGFFMESWHRRDFAEAGLDLEFVQDSHSRSSYRVLRGLHYQDKTAPMTKLLRCTLGSIFDAAVDLRINSPTFGRAFTIELTADSGRQLCIPPGFAHGFQTLSPFAEVQYKQTAFYRPSSEGTIAWDDPDIAIAWPLPDPILSARDRHGLLLRDYLKQPAFA